MGDETVAIGPDLEVTAGEFELWIQGMGHLPGMDVDSYLEAGSGLKIPKRVRERARSEALAERRARLAEELERVDKQLEDES